ncbi:MAG: hypothetical protein U1E67_12925 [Hyphomicrobiales bacterium]
MATGQSAFQTFKLSRPNLTYLQSVTSLGARQRSRSRNGELLKEESRVFFGRRATERVYTARQNDNAEKPMLRLATARPARGFRRVP